MQSIPSWDIHGCCALTNPKSSLLLARVPRRDGPWQQHCSKHDDNKVGSSSAAGLVLSILVVSCLATTDGGTKRGAPATLQRRGCSSKKKKEQETPPRLVSSRPHPRPWQFCFYLPETAATVRVQVTEGDAAVGGREYGEDGVEEAHLRHLAHAPERS